MVGLHASAIRELAAGTMTGAIAGFAPVANVAPVFRGSSQFCSRSAEVVPLAQARENFP